ncbi:TonB-dependent receptor plug domain-containing protein [Bacteroidota bacterium]
MIDLKKIWILLIVILVFVDIVYSEDKDTSTTEMPEVIVAADRILSNSAMKYNAYDIIDEDDFRKSNAWQLSEFISSVPGILINDYGGLGGLKTVSMRGTTSSQNIIMIDGIKINSSQSGIADLSSFPVSQFNNIEIVRGGASALFGANAIGGVMNLTNSEFVKDKYDLSLYYGSFNQYFLKTSASLGKGNLNESLSFEHKSSRGNYPFKFEFDDAEYNRYNSDFSMYSLSSLTNIKINSWKISGRVILNMSNRGIPGPSINDANLNENSDSRLNEKSGIVILSAMKQMNSSSSIYVGINTNVNQYSFNDDDFFGAGFAGLNADFTNRDIGIHAKYKTQVYNFIWNIGIESGFSDLRGNQIDLDKGDYVNRLSEAINISAESEFTIEDIGLLNYSFGGRFDNFSDAGSAFSEYIGTTFDVDNLPLKIRSQVSHNFRPPSFNEMYYLNFGNTDLKPEKSISVNIGLVLNVIRNIHFQIDGFYINTDDQIVAVPRSQVLWSAQNISNIISKGIEFSATGEIFDKCMSVSVAYTFQDVRDESSEGNDKGNLIGYVPQELIAGSISYNYHDFRIGSFLKYSSFNYSLPDNSYESIMPSYALVDFFISYEYEMDFAKVNFRIDCKNILDEQYAVILNYPMPGRYFRAGFSLNFE